MCAQQPGWRPWAYDLGKRDPNASNHPKAFVAAPDDTFLAAYALVPAEHRHAYEVVAGPCDLFLDLEREGEQWQHGSVLARAPRHRYIKPRAIKRTAHYRKALKDRKNQP